MDKKKTFTLSEIRKGYMNSKTGKKNLPVILAYGSALPKTKKQENRWLQAKRAKATVQNTEMTAVLSDLLSDRLQRRMLIWVSA